MLDRSDTCLTELCKLDTTAVHAPQSRYMLERSTIHA